MKNYAPIIVFCYRRNINKLIKSLLNNKESKKSDLYIFSDGFKSEYDKEDVLKVRKNIKKIKGFKSIQVIESATNNGLATSVINGVSSVIDKFGKAIILEDDLIVSKYFLNFMNNSLYFYQNNRKIWSISGYSPPINFSPNYNKEVYFSIRSSSWGWSTWSNRWNKACWSIKNFNNLKNNKYRVREFEKGGDDLFQMLELQKLGKIDSWAILWCYSQYINSAYSVTPKVSMVKNIGFNDGFGTHNLNFNTKWNVQLAQRKIYDLSCVFNKEIVDSFKKYHDINFYTKVGYFLRKWGGYNFIKKLSVKLK